MVLAIITLFPVPSPAHVVDSPRFDLGPGEAGGFLYLTQGHDFVAQPPTEPNGSWGPTTIVYKPDTYVYDPFNGTGFGILDHAAYLNGEVVARQLIFMNNNDPRQINHTFTIANPDGGPAFTLWFNRTGPGNVTRFVHLALGLGFVQVDGGPKLPAIVLEGHKTLINFYCLYHRYRGMTGYIWLEPSSGYGPPPPYYWGPSGNALFGVRMAMAPLALGAALVVLVATVSRSRV